MAEALDLNIPLGEDGTESVKNIIKPLLELEKEKNNVDENEIYTIENYYTDDSLGSDVLKNKYLACLGGFRACVPGCPKFVTVVYFSSFSV